jgi:hypothetical protein
VDSTQIEQLNVVEDVDMEDAEHAPVKMIVVDGIVMGHPVSLVTQFLYLCLLIWH